MKFGLQIQTSVKNTKLAILSSSVISTLLSAIFYDWSTQYESTPDISIVSVPI